MRFSIFTPTHKPAYLADAYRSLLEQSFADWEWVIVPNNGASLDHAILNDPRVLIVPAPEDIGRNVGALKQFACWLCHGEYLVELDHDDTLVEYALGHIDSAITVTGAHFLYSDAANVHANGSCKTFGKEWGWQQYPFAYREGSYTVNASFPLNASSLHQIFYAPDHVRVWHAETYRNLGGHDRTLEVCDDFDLVCRTYLAGTKFHHLPECLYLYQLHEDGSNTYLQRNAEIQAKQQDVSNRYVYALIAEWCRREALPMFDLGGGGNPAAGYQSIDLVGGLDVLAWLSAQPDSSVGCFRAADFLEHIPHCRDSKCKHEDGCVVGLMNDIHRCLVPGGWLVSRTPSTDGRGAFQDPTHCSYWNPNSFWYYTRSEQARFVPGIKARFQKTRLWQDYPSDWHRQHDIPYVHADLVALKGQRQPGLIEI